MADNHDCIKTLVLKHLQPSVITFGDELNLSEILGENSYNDPPFFKNDTLPSEDISINEKKTNDLTCSVCYKVFPSKRYLNRHFNKHTDKFKCPVCEKVLCRKESLLKHIPLCKTRKLSVFRKPKKEIHASPKAVYKFSCEKCSKRFTRQENYDQHIMNHYDMQVVCYICQKILRSFKSYRRHIKSHDSVKAVVKCEYCPTEFYHKSNLRRHLIHKHLDETNCQKCNRLVKHEYILRKHLSNETKSCAVCSELFCLKSDLKNHLKLEHQGLWFSCKQCSTITPFMTKCEHNLKEHVRKMHSIILKSADCYNDGWYVLLDC